MKYAQPHDERLIGKKPETPYEWYLFWLLAERTGRFRK